MHDEIRDELAEVAARHRTAEHLLFTATTRARAEGVSATQVAAVVGWPVTKVRRIAREKNNEPGD